MSLKRPEFTEMITNTIRPVMFYFLYFTLFCAFIFSCSGYDFSVQEHPKSYKQFPLGYMNLKNIGGPKREEDLNALHDLSGAPNYELDSYRDFLFEEYGSQFEDHKKKSDSRPKYDPGWKFIGLGKRPGLDEDLRFSPELQYNKGSVNPLLGISTLINFEFFNAIRDGIEDVEKETVKKEAAMSAPSGLTGGDFNSIRYNNKMNLFSGRQKTMYDPGWMLTGLGK